MAVIAVLVAVLAVVAAVESRAVNISNTWVLPEDGFPVFYRYFRDRINWFEADAVCQFHHANLVTVDTGAQFDAARAFLKELDVVSPVWLGLKRGRDQPHFLWTSEQPLSGAGYWSEPLPAAPAAEELCAAADPAADFRWHGLSCGGLEVASFICELPVPDWAAARDGCMVENLPSLTAAFLPEEAAVELTSDCGLGGTRRVVCKGNTTREALYAQLNCHNMMNEDATLGPGSGSGSGMPPGSGSGQDAEQAEPSDQSEQPEPEADDAYTSTGTSTETSASTTPGDQTSTRLRRATTSASSTAREVTTDVSVDTSVPSSSTETPGEPSASSEAVTASAVSAVSAVSGSSAAAASPARPATAAPATASNSATPSGAATPRPASAAPSPAPGHSDTLIVARKDDREASATPAAPAAASTAEPQAVWTPEDKPIIVPIVAKKGPSFPKKVTAASAKPFRPEKIPLKLRAPTAAPVRTVRAEDTPAAPAPPSAEPSAPRLELPAAEDAKTADVADKMASTTGGVVPEQDQQAPQPSPVADVLKIPAAVNTDSDNKLDDSEFTNHMAGDAADDLDDALMIRELSSARTPLIKSVPVVDVPLDEPRTAAATAQPAASAAATSPPATATKLSKESAVFLSLPVDGRVVRRPPVKKDGLPAAIAGAAVTTTSTTTTTTTTPAPPSTAATPTTTADPNATTASPVRLRESMAGPGGKARTLTTAPPAPSELSGVPAVTSTTTAAPTTSTSTVAPTTPASPTTAAAARNASTVAPPHATDSPASTPAPPSTARPEPGNGEAPKERRRQHLPAPLLSMNMKPEEDGEEGLESEPQSPPRPNRSRSLVSHQHRTFYPYFLNRVLGR